MLRTGFKLLIVHPAFRQRFTTIGMNNYNRSRGTVYGDGYDALSRICLGIFSRLVHNASSQIAVIEEEEEGVVAFASRVSVYLTEVSNFCTPRSSMSDTRHPDVPKSIPMNRFPQFSSCSSSVAKAKIAFLVVVILCWSL